MPETTQRRNTNTNANNANGRENGHLDIRDLKEMNISSLTQVAKDMNVAGYMLKHRPGQSFLKAIGMLQHFWRVIEFPE